MKEHAVFLPVFCFLIACQFFSQSYCCSCLDPLLNHHWGEWKGSSRCVGRCSNSVEIKKRYCHVYNVTGRFYEKELCEVRNSADCGNCRGSWSEWGNIGQCNGECGPGLQMQQRLCYKKNNPGRNIRTDDCYGANGSSEDNRKVGCTRLSNCRNIIIEHLLTGTTTAAVETTTTPTTTIMAKTTTTIPAEHSEKKAKMTKTTTTLINVVKNQTKDSQINYKSSKDHDIDQPKEEKRDSPTMKPNGLDSVTLAAILGSVAIVCVTIVAIAVAIMFLKRHDIKKNASSLPNPTSIVKIDSTRNRRSDVNFDSVPLPIPLPSATSSYGQVANPLYETAFANGNPIEVSIPESQYPENQVPHVLNKNIDPIYFCVDDYNR